MTEDEAKTKWCPPAGSGAEYPRKIRKYDDVGGPAGTFAYNCIGSDCMAWRWKRDPVGWMVSIDGRPERYWTWDPSSEPGFEGRVSIRPVDLKLTGHCGLAGRLV